MPSGETITIKFIEAASTGQPAWKHLLDDVFRRLKAEGWVRKADVQAVFPGETDPELAAMFTVDVDTPAADLREPLRRVREIPGIQFAQVAGSRRELGVQRR